MKLVADCVGEALHPPSVLPLDEWAETNVFLDHTSAIPGRISLEFYPPVRALLRHAQNRRTRRLVAITSAQSGKTQSALITLLHRIAENPTPAMWVTATFESAKDFARKRLFPSILECPPVARLAPHDRTEWTGTLVQFASMNLMMRGANSRVGLQSDPVGLLICDERREWKAGMIELARKRVRTFANFLELSIGTAGVGGDALHRDFMEGSQTFFHFACPECQHSQPFRFGRNPTSWFPEKRERGGIVWEENETTRTATGSWDYDAVRRSAKYECESCGARFGNTDKARLLRSVVEHHRNPKALPEKPSLQWNAIMMPLASCDFGEIAVEFLIANDTLKKTGDQEALKSFVTETLGEPWEARAEKVSDEDILARIGQYASGELAPCDARDATLVLSLDRQQNHMIFVLRQWFRGGRSRLIRCGVLSTVEDVRGFQLEHKVRHVIGDDGGPNVTDWRAACARNGWHTFKGEDVKHFTVKGRDDLPLRAFWRESRCDPGIGTAREGRAEIPLFLWSRPHYLEKLLRVFVRGHGPVWELPSDISGDYVRQLAANEQREKQKPDGSVSHYWHTTGADHYADAELMNLAFADVSGIVRHQVEIKPQEAAHE